MTTEFYQERALKSPDGEFARAFTRMYEVIKSVSPTESNVMCDLGREAIRLLKIAENDFLSAREKALRDLMKYSPDTPGRMIKSGSMFPFTYGWGSQLDDAAARHDQALANFWEIFRAGVDAGIW